MRSNERCEVVTGPVTSSSAMISRLFTIFTILFLLLHDNSLFVAGDCAEPTNIPDEFTYEPPNSYGEGAVIVYECSHGYVKDSGDGTSTCVKTGSEFSWSEPTLKCIPALCPEPPRIDNGRYVGTDFSFGKKVSYECKDGYKLKTEYGGDGELICLEKREWNGDVPKCEAIQCPQLTVPKGGMLSSTARNYNAAVTTACNPGYVLKGERMIRCLATGEWSSPQATCEEVECMDPDSDDFKRKYKNVIGILETGVSQGNTVTFNCLGETKEYESVCKSSGLWMPPPPNCVKEVTTSTVGAITESTVTSVLPDSSTTSTSSSIYTLTPSVIPSLPTDGVTSSPTSSTDGTGTDDTGTVSPVGQDFPVWAIVLVVISLVLIAVTVAILIFRKISRKNNYRSADKEKADAESDALAHNTTHV